MSIDATLHSIFGASKVAADVMVQEYGRYFGMHTSVFRGGTLTGPNHAAAELHGFLAYVMQCTMTGTPYRVFGYQGKQVRDAIHSADLISCFDHVHRAARGGAPRSGEVYNIGGGRLSNCSVLEAIAFCEEITGNSLDWTYVDDNRVGDHIWWIGDNGHFAEHYPTWSSPTTCRRSSPRCTTPTAIAGRPMADPRHDRHRQGRRHRRARRRRRLRRRCRAESSLQRSHTARTGCRRWRCTA